MMKDHYNERAILVRRLRKEQGICVRCGKEKAREGKTCCKSCAEYNSKKALEYHYKRKAENNAVG